MSDIDISGLDKVDVLCALYNAARPQGMGFLHYTPEDLGREEAAEALKLSAYFDYFHGRVMKVDLSKDVLFAGLYDRDNGPGAALRALQRAGLVA